MYESIAHITQIDGVTKIQTVREHCRQTAQYAAESAMSVGLRNTAYLAGLLHDMGKCKRAFDDYILRSFEKKTVKRGTINHTFAGVIFVFERYHREEESQFYANLTCEILAFAIASHHGLIDGVGSDFINGYVYRLSKNRSEIDYEESYNNFLTQCANVDELDELFRQSCDEVEHFFNVAKKYVSEHSEIKLKFKGKTLYFLLGMMARFVLSALIDGDRRDTAEFMQGVSHEFIKVNQTFWQDRVAYFEDIYQREILTSTPDTPINRVRTYISDCAKAFANQTDGIYRMTVKTGAGKTLSALRFALHSAELNKKRRIIFVIPLLSILEQNATVIQKYVGDCKYVLEHHSNVVREEQGNRDEQLDSYELFAECWDSPIIITTLVQLLNVLFSGKTTAVRRMKSLSESIIIIDEVQSVPRKLMYMFNLALDYLAHFCHCTIVLSSATQPCFEQMDYPMILSENADMITETEAMRTAFKRTEIIDKSSKYGMDMDTLVDFARNIIAENESLLIICNTKRTALALYRQLLFAKNDDFNLYHLSTNMCASHRRDMLSYINKDLTTKDGRKVVCVSTQLVEAGVDFSFESCIRVKAGLDNIAQAAGRCNRNGEFNKLCKVYVVSLKDENIVKLPDIVASQTAYTEFAFEYKRHASEYGDMLSAKSVAFFYQKLMTSTSVKNILAYPTRDKNVTMLEMLSDNYTYSNGCKRGDKITKTVLNQAFKTAGKEFCVFEDNTIDVIVPYNAEAEEIINALFSGRAKSDYSYFKRLITRAKPYTIALFDYQLKNSYMFYSDKENRFIAVHKEYYDKNTGFGEQEMIFS